MQLIYFLVALVLAAVAGVFGTPIVGIIVFVVLAGAILLLAGGGASAARTRTSTPEPTGRPRTSPSGVETSNQRQGQD